MHKLKKQFNAIKQEQFPWMYESPKDANQQPFTNLGKAFARWFQWLKTQEGKPVGRPAFKKKGMDDRFYISNDKLKLHNRRIDLGTIKNVKLTEDLRYHGKIMSATVSREADRWFVSLQVEVCDLQRLRCGNGVIGVDLGVARAVTLSTGEVMQGPKPLRKAQKKLRCANRRLHRRKKGSNNRAKARRIVAKCHRRVANVRRDFLHKVTTKLCRENQAVVIEDLHVAGMMRNHALARAISDIGMGEFRRQLEYKAPIWGTHLLIADRWFPSSKQCSECHRVLEELPLSQRVFRCDGLEGCGLVLDRDLNASRNLEHFATTAGYAGSHAWGETSAGLCTTPEVKLFSLSQEPNRDHFRSHLG